MGYVADLELGPDGQVLPVPEPAPRERLRYEAEDEQISLCELLDRVLNKGVIVRGEIVITVADVELLYLGVELILCATETARQAGIRLPTDMTDARLLPPAPRPQPAEEALRSRVPSPDPARAQPSPEPRPEPRSEPRSEPPQPMVPEPDPDPRRPR